MHSPSLNFKDKKRLHKDSFSSYLCLSSFVFLLTEGQCCVLSEIFYVYVYTNKISLLGSSSM